MQRESNVSCQPNSKTNPFMTAIPGKSTFKTILLAGLTAGALDATAAMISFAIKVPGANPLKVWRFVASGALGSAALTKELVPMALTGLVFHFIIAFLFTIFFFFIFQKIKWLSRNLAITGLLYGIFVWIVMNLIIVPLSGVPAKSKLWSYAEGRINFQFPADPTQLFIGILILMFCIGLPISLITGNHFRKNSKRER